MKLRSKPSLKEKKRYIIFRVISEDKIHYQNLSDAIWNSLLEWIGEKEVSKAGIWIIKNLWDGKQQKGFIKCHPKYVDSVKIGLGLVHQIGDSRVIIQTLRVAGTIKSGKEKTKEN